MLTNNLPVNTAITSVLQSPVMHQVEVIKSTSDPIMLRAINQDNNNFWLKFLAICCATGIALACVNAAFANLENK